MSEQARYCATCKWMRREGPSWSSPAWWKCVNEKAIIVDQVSGNEESSYCVSMRANVTGCYAIGAWWEPIEEEKKDGNE